MDTGCYGVSMSRLIAGEEPCEVRGVAHLGSSEVDEWAAVLLRFPSGAVASVTCGAEVFVEPRLRVFGSNGWLSVESPWLPVAGGNRILVGQGQFGEPLDEIVVEGGADLYAIEVDAVAEHLAERESPAMTWSDTLGNLAVLDAWRADIGLAFAGEPSQGGQ